MSNSHATKKVGILTLPLTHNYGGLLQCIALQIVLQEMGFQILVFNRGKNEPAWRRTTKKVLFRHYFAEIERFKNIHLTNRTRLLTNSNNLRQEISTSTLDAIVVGSDQVWRELYSVGDFSDNFLAFLEDTAVTKVAYAASFGVATIKTPRATAEISEALKTFNGISVREQSGLKILKDTFGVQNATLALDPTLLLPKNFYEQLCDDAKSVPSKKTLAVYVLDERDLTLSQIDSVAGRMSLSVVQIKHQPKHSWRRIFQQKAGVGAWLQTIKNADFVITDSYHGMLFSILFKKQFVVLVNEKRGATRFESLAQQLGIQDRLVKDVTISNEPSWFTDDIDYIAVDTKLAKLREVSLEFLKNNLNG
ncbi:polysaccharide pyruvyl transferase family protein [Rasiella rasia]|uniref:Polysaccharide pyruvyl transferase family protein n=1 Tax=Rasiella rasia TaxID=2744027 RepID=A0A6G6GI85_9FLAO|nr:polysaccharide pyruvyl transferase family protein [Rasiella rasia]QIE58259.1 polysaccharide pyruvyl transferase family protein [Rasiella rasia]